MKNVLIIANFKSSLGGISGQVEILLEELEKNNDINVALFNSKGNPIKRFYFFLKLLYIGSKHDVFHIHGCSWLGFYPIILGVFAGKILRKKLIVTYHGGGVKDFINKYKRLVCIFLKRVDILTAPSIYVQEILMENNIETIYLPNIIRSDNTTFKKRKEFKLDFVVTRSLEPVYNIPLAIKAFSIIQKTYPASTLRFVGDGTLRGELEILVKDLELKNVCFLGRVPNSEIGLELNKADIYLNPTSADNMPLSLFEAFASGLIVISTDVGGLPGFITHQSNGLLIENNNVNQLVEQVRYVLEHQEKTVIMVENAYVYYQDFTLAKLLPRYISLYKN